LLGREDEIEFVPNQDGKLPPSKIVPWSIQVLIVAGNEKRPCLPGQEKKRTHWNKKKSKQLLQFYGEKCESDSEDEETSWMRRLRVAQKLGITRTQLNFAQMTL
jgi:hypothetical protein